jgi:hypothetical protein
LSSFWYAQISATERDAIFCGEALDGFPPRRRWLLAGHIEPAGATVSRVLDRRAPTKPNGDRSAESSVPDPYAPPRHEVSDMQGVFAYSVLSEC